MKRIFITTDVEKAAYMYSNTNHIARKVMVETDFTDLTNGKEYTYGNDFKVIVLEDTFTNWTKYQINQANDYILYHTSSERNVITRVTTAFVDNHTQNGSHILEELHDRVYRIIFDNEGDKPNRILNVLGFTNEQIEEKEAIEAKLNFLHHCLTPEGLAKDEVTKSEWAKLDEFAILNKTTDGPFGKGYIPALTALRNALLLN